MSAPMMMLPVPPDGDVSRGPALLGVIWTMVAIDIVVVALRLWVRFAKRSVGADDYLMLLACIFFIATVAVETMIVHYGLGKHMYYVPPQNGVPFLKWVFILQSFTFFTLAFAKASIAILIMRLMGVEGRWLKRLLWVNIVFFFICAILSTVFDLVSCTPIQAQWDHTIQDAKCWPLSVNADWAIFISSYSSFLDFLLALVPISIIWKLKLDTKKKIAISVLLGLGMLSGVAAAVKTSESQRLGSQVDFTWEAWSLYAWSTAEYFLNILCGTVPTLKPLYECIVNGKPMRPSEGRGGRSIFYGSSMRSDRFRLGNFSKDSNSKKSGSAQNISEGTTTWSTKDSNNKNIVVEQSYDIESASKNSQEPIRVPDGLVETPYGRH
ncbi:hypothetical protein G7Y89_g1493 [Cudoniella acicularis]|uniref:Rhodopsin domain-containing protein n=1 Tax=Cudoniella acicularis TaxID=354080 RepID=A0A8H4RW96_9HELO|nr:hypothetical protein G7Y89_g1493 [Cudoniella acicularis]